MKASELIQQLQALIAEYGDLDVCLVKEYSLPMVANVTKPEFADKPFLLIDGEKVWQPDGGYPMGSEESIEVKRAEANAQLRSVAGWTEWLYKRRK